MIFIDLPFQPAY